MNISFTFTGTKSLWQIILFYNHKPSTVYTYTEGDGFREALAFAKELRMAGIPIETENKK